MAATIYQSKTVTAEKMDAFFKEMAHSGKTMLPTELELSTHLGASRRVIRELLQEKEANGDIIKKAHGRALPIQKESRERFGFLVEGENMPYIPTWIKLWLALQQKAAKYNLNAEIFLYPWNATADDYRAVLAKAPEIVIIATGGLKIIGDQEAILGKKIIYIDEDYCFLDGNFIGLDNYEAGRMAAQELIRNGYRKPLLVSYNIPGFRTKYYGMYANRIRGFQDECTRNGVSFSAEKDVSILDLPNTTRLRLETIASFAKTTFGKSKNYDSIFVVSDSNIDLIYEAIQDMGIKIPEDLGFITLNCFDNAVNHIPPITSVSTATYGIADKLLAFISECANGSGKSSAPIYIKPDIHAGKTLKIQGEKTK